MPPDRPDPRTSFGWSAPDHARDDGPGGGGRPSGRKRSGRRRRKAPKKISETYLRRLASWYLERWDAPAARVRQVLDKRIRRAVAHHGQDPDDCAALADKVVAELVDAGVIDDARYAQQRVYTMRQRGASTRKIRSALRSKGVEGRLITEALAEPADPLGRPPDPDAPSPERLAALRYARRRSFGPWRRPDREPRPDKEIASMGRAGFSWSLSREVVQADPSVREAWENLLFSHRG